MEVFKLLGTISINNSEANQALDETSQKGQDTQSKLSSALDKAGSVAATAGRAVVTGLAAGAAAMTGITAKALSASGELEQNMGGSEAVFGEYASKMQETAKSAFSNMGLSTSDYLATANKMGALFQGAGFDIEESMSLSSDAMQRAADVASIMGIDTGAAMEAIAGAAKGNFTMMDNLGVAINETTLQSYALEKGISKSTSEMTNQEKIGLAMELFMEKTAYAAGNYAKENDTLAGSLGTAKSALTNFLDGSGDVESLVASFGNLADVAVESLNEILPRLTTGLTDIVNQVMPLLPPLLQTLLPSIVDGAIALVDGLVSAFPGIISALMNVLPSLIDGVQQIINSLIDALPGIIEAIVSALPALIPALVDGLVSLIVTLCATLPEIVQPIIDYLPEIIVSIVNALMENLPALIDGAVQLVVGLVAALPQIILALLNALPDVIVSITNGLLGALPTLIEGVGQIITAVITAVWDFLAGFPESVGNFVGKLWADIGNIIFNVWEIIKSVISTAINTVIDVIFAGFEGIWNFIVGVWNGIKAAISGAWEGITSSVFTAIHVVSDAICSVFNGVANTVAKIWNGIKDSIKEKIESARDLVKNAIDAIKGFFNFTFSWPHIPLPHFSISPSGWKVGDLLKGTIPSLGISWYAKAMDNPMIMKSPTAFGINSKGQIMAGGEAGEEVVSGKDTLLEMIAQVVASRNEDLLDMMSKLYQLHSLLIPQIIDGMDRELVLDSGVLVGQLTPVIDRKLGTLSKYKARGN